MPTGTLNFHVAAIGPSDVQEELKLIESIVSKLSREFLARNVTLSFHHWRHLAPGIGSPQQYIDSNIQWEQIDFVIGAMWKKFGSPVEDADSGTEHECNEILKLSARGQPDLLFYFRDTADTEPAADQLKIESFRKSLYKKALIGTYRDKNSFREQVETAIRSKVEGKLSTQNQVQRRIGKLPVNRSFTVELIIFSEFPERGQTPTVIILKDCRGKYFVIDTRYSTGQSIADWMAQTMGFAVTEGMTLNEYLMQVNLKNIQANNGLLQLWLGNVIYADHPTFKMKKLKMLLCNTHSHEGKLGWDLSKGSKTIQISVMKPQIIVDRDGTKDITL